MFKSSKKKSTTCSFCEILSIVLMALASICTLAAIAGVYQAHVLSGGLTFGTSTGSLSILSLAISLFLLKKACEACPCQVKVTTKK